MERSSIAKQLRGLFARLQASAHSSHSTEELMQSFGWKASDVGHQHDVQEFAHAILNAVEEVHTARRREVEEAGGLPGPEGARAPARPTRRSEGM